MSTPAPGTRSSCCTAVSSTTSEPDFRDPRTTSVLAEWGRALAAGGTEAWVEAFLRFVPGPHRIPGDVSTGILRRQREMALGAILEHTADEPDRRVPVTGTWERIEGIGVPVLAVHGGLDAEDHLRMAERLARTVANSRSATVEVTAHYPNMERPDQYNALVTDFLTTLRRPCRPQGLPFGTGPQRSSTAGPSRRASSERRYE